MPDPTHFFRSEKKEKKNIYKTYEENSQYPNKLFSHEIDEVTLKCPPKF
jgi:hypothetical protein